MRYRHLLVLIALTSANALAQFANQLAEQQADQMRLLQMQSELNLARMQADTDRIRKNSERLVERMRAEDEQTRRTEQLNSLLDQRSAEQEKSAKKAADAADDLREEINLSSVKAFDMAYLASAIALPIFLGIYIAKRAEKDGVMKYEQRFGVVVMLCALLIALLAITISVDWYPRLDALQNILLNLRIKFFEETDPPYGHSIDIPTKYVLAVLAAGVAYGFTTYLGITPAWKNTGKTAQSQESANEN